MRGPDIIVTDVIAPELQQTIAGGLNAFNDAATGTNDRRPLAVVVKDQTGAPVGGAIGRTSLGLAFLDLFFLPEAMRGVYAEKPKGFGAQGAQPIFRPECYKMNVTQLSLSLWFRRVRIAVAARWRCGSGRSGKRDRWQ